MNKKDLDKARSEILFAYKKGQLKKAEAKTISLLNELPEDSWGLHILGCLRKEAGDYDSAITLIQKSISFKRDDPLFLLNLAKIFELKGQYQESKTALQNSISINHNICESWFCLGNILRKLGEPKQAQKAYENSLILKPSHARAAGNLGAMLIEENEANKAIKYLNIALEADPNTASYASNLGHAWKKEKNNLKAISYFEYALEIQPNDAQSLQILGELYKAEGRHTKSAEMYKRAIDLNPSEINAVVGLGWLFLTSDLKEEAIDYFSKRLNKNQRDTDALFFLFEAHKGRLRKKATESFSYSNSFIRKSISLIGASRIIAFGDSHVLYFDGFDEIEVNHVGASTAYNLKKASSTTGGRKKVMEHLEKLNPHEHAVLLCFGEVDIRANAIKQCYLKRTSIEDIAKDIAQRYIDFANEICSRGFKIIIYGGYGAGNDRASYGSNQEKNYAAYILNKLMEKLCAKNKLIYFSLHDIMFDEKNLQTDSYFLHDDFHLHCQEGSKRELQIMLADRLYQAIVKMHPKPATQKQKLYIAGNISNPEKIVFGTLSRNQVEWDSYHESIETITVDLGERINASIIKIVSRDSTNFTDILVSYDGTRIKHQVTQVRKNTWHAILPISLDMPLARFITIASNPEKISAIKAIHFQIKDLVAGRVDF